MNTSDHASPGGRPVLRRIFFEPADTRLRSGWRLLIHTLLLLFLLLLFGTLLTLILAGLGLIEIDPETLTSRDSPLLLLGPLLAITVATWLVRRFLDKKSFLSLGFTWDDHAAADLAFGILMPGGLFALIFLFEWAAGWLHLDGFAFSGSQAGAALPRLIIAAITFVIVGYQEELLSRGYHLQTLIEGTNLPLGLFISSGIFALLHAANPGASILSTLGILLAGYFLGYAWIRTGQMWLPIGLHIGWNFFQGTVFGFQVSGTTGFNLIEQTVQGPTLITGGAFGPEAGLTGFAAMALGSYAIWWFTRQRQ